ncbi:hypothetical protein EYC84_002507 [Monilinia fructicola]|uniref:Uncharacterized protein n=1 Tax=Monilinia fructicola TaxID=38448 RepID=A0A5M9JP46_MONFR|nr:hypothetical protein EYC84_002507 [Monilinia fructicola]
MPHLDIHLSFLIHKQQTSSSNALARLKYIPPLQDLSYQHNLPHFTIKMRSSSIIKLSLVALTYLCVATPIPVAGPMGAAGQILRAAQKSPINLA